MLQSSSAANTARMNHFEDGGSDVMRRSALPRASPAHARGGGGGISAGLHSSAPRELLVRCYSLSLAERD